MSGQARIHERAAGGRLVPTAPPTSVADDPHVSQVSTAPASPEALLAGVFLGAVAAVLAVLALGFGVGDVLREWSAAGCFLLVWAVASWGLSHDTGRVLVVVRRGFLLGTVQWAALAVRWSGGEVSDGRPLAALISGGTPAVLTWLCLAGFVLCWLASRSPYRELESDRP